MIASSNTVAPLKSLTQPDATWRVTFCPRTSVVRADPGPAKPWRGVTGQRPANSNPPSAPARASGDGAWLRAAQHPGAAGDAPDRSRFSWFCLSCVYSRPRKTGQSKPAGRCENPTGSAERLLGHWDDFRREINVSLSCRHNRCRAGARRSQCVHRGSRGV